MEKTPHAIDDMLLDYLDGTLPVSAREEVERQLQQHEAVRMRFEELKVLHLTLLQLTPEVPSRNFTEQVMGRLNESPARSWSIRKALLLFVLVSVSIVTALLLVSLGAFNDTTAIVQLPTEGIPETLAPDNLPSITFNGKLMINIIILLNIVLAWVILDRTILRPYFQRRMQTGH